MHLLLARKETVAEADEAIDLGQSPADVLFLSAADTELASLSAAKSLLGEKVPALRLASLMALGHPMSVDAYVERTARHARLIVVRVIGGESYWRYGLETLHAVALEHGIALAVLAGDDRPDPGLARFATVERADVDMLWRYLVEGGSDNAQNFLRYCGFLLGYAQKPAQPAVLMKAGLWWPGMSQPMLDDLRPVAGLDARPVVAITFYRALVQSGQTAPVAALITALQNLGLAPLPVFVSSLKDPLSVSITGQIFSQCRPDLVLNATGFAVAAPEEGRKPTVLEKQGNMVLQVIFSSATQESWQQSARGLTARDVAMNVSLPEVDGRVLTRAVSFKTAEFYDAATECTMIHHKPVADRVDFVARLAANWVALRNKQPASRRIAMIMANYPGGDGRLGHGVGLDTPAAVMVALRAMQAAGYDVEHLPQDGDALMRLMALGPTNEGMQGRIVRESLPLATYQQLFAQLPPAIRSQMLARWGAPQHDAYVTDGGFALPVMRFGGTVVGIQPERAFGMDAKQVYHDPDIVPTHHYLAFYFWLRHVYKADAVVHMGKHGNLEWLPGKALALSADCYPEIALGPLPHIYPFIVNDPGEGTQAKRRSSAVIVDHMTPPLTRAESYGLLKDLEALVDEYYEAAAVDPRRLEQLKTRIIDLVELTGINRDAGINRHDDDDMALQKLDAFLCDLKELQIRDGLHIFGRAPQGEQLTSLLVALVRVPRGTGGCDSLHRAIARDLKLGFDPLDCDMTESWRGPRPHELASLTDDPWRTAGDTVERIEILCTKLVGGALACPDTMAQTALVLQNIEQELRPLVLACGKNEISSLLLALDGGFVPPGPSGAPTRGRTDVLPTGRNFFSVDSRAVPTCVAWDLGRRSAELLITRYVQDHGTWPTSFGLTAWGTSNMRTGGDDVAQALALIGVKPVWDMASRRVTGYEIIPLARLGRPRVDVTLRISGFFRDAFPAQLALLDQAFRAVGGLEEPDEDNPIAARMRRDAATLEAGGPSRADARRPAGSRHFGAVAHETGQSLHIYHNDLSRPERPLIKTLEEEIGRTLRGRAVNPKWIASAMRHGYKGGVEMAATVDYLFAFAATTRAVADTHFDAVYDAYLADECVRQFLQEKNPAALREIAARLDEAVRRNLWKPRSNSARFALDNLRKGKSENDRHIGNR